MAKTFFICNAIKFPAEAFSTDSQLQLVEPDGLGLTEGEPTTRLLPSNKVYLDDFHTYDCYHETTEKVFGKVFGKNFAYYLRPHEFYSFCNFEKELAFFRLNTDSSEEVIKLLNAQPNYKISKFDINFAKIITKLHEISGMWVKVDNNQNLNSAAYFGKDVDRDPGVQEMIENGELSYIQMKFIKDGHEHKIGISKRGSITLYNNYQNLEAELEMIWDIYIKLLA
ncbi:hypothetical protein [Bacillus cereus]|uniref:hypothetical protein n=1 Tax=Bacillus cereus TaxID=1396 RepID=UPI002570AF87|nr:hypothetical protein [Bacillus cereus]WJE24511.1 hypothetical protein QRE65_22160 [Bacillus cereus]